MKKGVEIAFAITLMILSVIATVWSNDVIDGIIYAVVIPSFMLTVISFVSDIANGCEKDAGEWYEHTQKLSELSQKIADLELKNYTLGISKTPYVAGSVPKEVYDKTVESQDYLKRSLEYAKTQIFFLRCKRVCDIIIMVGYVILFLSLCLSPLIARWLAAVNLNCITMWSLAVLYVTLQLKKEMCALVFKILHKINKKRLNVDSLLEEDTIEEASVLE